MHEKSTFFIWKLGVIKTETIILKEYTVEEEKFYVERVI